MIKDPIKRKEYAHAYYIKNKHRWDKTRLKRKKWFQEIKSKSRCVSCGENHIACLEFHHRDPTKKKFTIGSDFRTHCWGDVLEEIKKCDVLCSNCHKKLHWEGTSMVTNSLENCGG